MGVVIVLALLMAPSLLGLRTITLETAALEPAVGQGTLLLQEAVLPAELQPGDIISFTTDRNPGVTFTQQVSAVQKPATSEGVHFTTTGMGREPEEGLWVVHPSQPVGRTVFQVPLAGYVVPYLASTPLMIAALVAGLALLWARGQAGSALEAAIND